MQRYEKQKRGEDIEPIELVETNVIYRRGYYCCEIVDFRYQKFDERPLLVIVFKVFKGKYRNFRLSSGFYYKEHKGKVRFTHLCKAVGVTRKQVYPKDLLGKRLRLRVVPKFSESEGRTYRNYLITRFHGLKEDTRAASRPFGQNTRRQWTRKGS